MSDKKSRWTWKTLPKWKRKGGSGRGCEHVRKKESPQSHEWSIEHQRLKEEKRNECKEYGRTKLLKITLAHVSWADTLYPTLLLMRGTAEQNRHKNSCSRRVMSKNNKDQSSDQWKNAHTSRKTSTQARPWGEARGAPGWRRVNAARQKETWAGMSRKGRGQEGARAARAPGVRQTLAALQPNPCEGRNC